MTWVLAALIVALAAASLALLVHTCSLNLRIRDEKIRAAGVILGLSQAIRAITSEREEALRDHPRGSAASQLANALALLLVSAYPWSLAEGRVSAGPGNEAEFLQILDRVIDLAASSIAAPGRAQAVDEFLDQLGHRVRMGQLDPSDVANLIASLLSEQGARSGIQSGARSLQVA